MMIIGRIWSKPIIDSMYSLGEIESHCKNAARGVGLSWGVAQEAGFAARRLAEFNFPGPETIFFNLKAIDEKLVDYYFTENRPLTEVTSPISGFLYGIYILDRLDEFFDRNIVISNRVIGPLALVGLFLHLQCEGYSFSIKWDNVRFSMRHGQIFVEGSNINPSSINNLEFNIFKCTINKDSVGQSFQRRSVENWSLLSEFAGRINVPASEKSRLFGAGAGENEND